MSDDPDRRPPGWPALAVYAVAFVLVLVLGLAFVALVAWLRSPGPVAHVVDGANAFALSRAGLMTGALVNAVVLGAVALVAAGRPRAERLRLGPSRATGIGIAAATTGVVGVSFFCSAVSELARVRGGGVLEAIAHGLESLPPVAFVLAILCIGVAPGFAEETFFRGFMQTRLTAAWGRWPAIGVSAAAFGLLHLDPVQGGLAFVAGLFLGWLADRFGGIRPTIAAHAMNNALFVAAASLGASAEGPRGAELAQGLAGALVWAASVAVLRSRYAVRASTRAS